MTSARKYRPRWRHWCHRAGILPSAALTEIGVPFGTARQRRRRADRALHRLATRGACPDR
ncbi:hypothetical protein ACSMX9_22680 [Streptomyces sp. LE64]|uniref:hypothetical protein n=1 Tax=Streptomyces sp. LE64 TaxID=3448653 RepID=UPI004042524C